MKSLLFVLVPCFFLGLYLIRFYSRKAWVDGIRKRANTRRARDMRKNHPLSRMNREQAVLYSTMFATSLSGLLLCHFVLTLPTAIGIVIGGVLPPFLLQLWREYWLDRYEADVDLAIEYGAGHFQSGLLIEQWIQELPSHLDGPLVAVFEKGALHIEQKLSAVDFLESIARTTPSPYFAYVLTGMVSNLESGDMVQFVDEVQFEMIHRSRHKRVMRQIRKESTRLLLAMTFLPVFLYSMFSRSVNALANSSYQHNLVLGIGIFGYALLIWFARESTKPKRL